MIPENIAIVFLVLPVACLAYIFRGLTSESNPIWGNIIASGLSALICAMAAIWLIQGTIVSPSIVGNSTYQLSADLTLAEALQEQANLSEPSYKLSPGGAGMYVRSPMSDTELTTSGSTITVHTYDIVYNQFQNIGLVLLYALGFVISIALFGWFIIDMRKALQEQDAYQEESLDGWYR